MVSCRPAELINKVWLEHYRGPTRGAAGLDPGECGFCVAGHSGGAAQIAYALSVGPLENKIEAAFPSSGPPMGAIKKGCMNNHDSNQYGYGDEGEVPPEDDDTTPGTHRQLLRPSRGGPRLRRRSLSSR